MSQGRRGRQIGVPTNLPTRRGPANWKQDVIEQSGITETTYWEGCGPTTILGLMLVGAPADLQQGLSQKEWINACKLRQYESEKPSDQISERLQSESLENNQHKHVARGGDWSNCQQHYESKREGKDQRTAEAHWDELENSRNQKHWQKSGRGGHEHCSVTIIRPKVHFEIEGVG